MRGIVADTKAEARLVAQTFLRRYRRSCRESEIRREAASLARRTTQENKTKERGTKTTGKKTKMTNVRGPKITGVDDAMLWGPPGSSIDDA